MVKVLNGGKHSLRLYGAGYCYCELIDILSEEGYIISSTAPPINQSERLSPCQFCSNETSYHPCTWIKRDGTIFKPIKTGFVVRELGQICNNTPLGEEIWVDKMVRCPARWERSNKPKPLFPITTNTISEALLNVQHNPNLS